jgi:hypothetical protein
MASEQPGDEPRPCAGRAEREGRATELYDRLANVHAMADEVDDPALRESLLDLCESVAALAAGPPRHPGEMPPP